MGFLTEKPKQLAIRDILHEGDLVDDLALVKTEFLDHFKNWFAKPMEACGLVNHEFSNILRSDHAIVLEENVTPEEIKSSVWDCGTDKL